MQGTQGLPTGRLDRYYKDGVVFVTYSTLISKGGREGRGAAVKLPNEPQPEGGFGDGSDSDDDNESTDEFGMPGVWRHAPSCWSQCSCSRRLALGILMLPCRGEFAAIQHVIDIFWCSFDTRHCLCVPVT